MIGLFQVGVAIIIEREGKILLGKRAADKDFGADLWEIPAGRLNTGENPEEAVVREAKEELGIDITSMVIIDAYGFKRGDHDLILLTYSCEFTGEIKKSDEHDQLKWVSLREVKSFFKYGRQKKIIDKYLQSR